MVDHATVRLTPYPVTISAASPVDRLVDRLLEAGVTHVVGIPDNTSAPLFDALSGREPPKLVTVTREGEAFALASGLWLGGASPLVVVQNTGLLEAGDALRGTAVRMGAPIPIVVTGRGYPKMEAAGLGPQAERTREVLTRPDVDSVALVTEPTLDAWGIPYSLCRSEAHASEAICDTVRRARKQERPVALLLVGAMV